MKVAAVAATAAGLVGLGAEEAVGLEEVVGLAVKAVAVI